MHASSLAKEIPALQGWSATEQVHVRKDDEIEPLIVFKRLVILGELELT